MNLKMSQAPNVTAGEALLVEIIQLLRGYLTAIVEPVDDYKLDRNGNEDHWRSQPGSFDDLLVAQTLS